MIVQGVRFRSFDPTTDEPFVMATWIRSHRDMACTPRVQRTNAALDVYRREAERLLNEYGAVVACDENEETTIHGWACGSPGTLHYVYVPKDLRCLGLGKALIERAIGGYLNRIDVTHRWPWPSRRFVLVEKVKAA